MGGIRYNEGEEVSNNNGLPPAGFMRLSAVLNVIPVSKSSWWRGVKSGIYPAAVKIGPSTTAWRVDDIRDLIERLDPL